MQQGGVHYPLYSGFRSSAAKVCSSECSVASLSCAIDPKWNSAAVSSGCPASNSSTFNEEGSKKEGVKEESGAGNRIQTVRPRQTIMTPTDHPADITPHTHLDYHRLVCQCVCKDLVVVEKGAGAIRGQSVPARVLGLFGIVAMV